MEKVIEGWTTLQLVFGFAAVFGGTIFGITTLLSFMGAGVEEFDGQLEADIDGGGSEPGFKALSLQGMSAFLLMGGTSGLAASLQFAFSSFLSTTVALVCGGAMLVLLHFIFSLFQGFSSNGAIDISQALCETGEVYLTIPAGGTGVVQLVVQGRMVTLDAVAADGAELRTGREVVVRDLLGENAVVVTPIEDASDIEIK